MKSSSCQKLKPTLKDYVEGPIPLVEEKMLRVKTKGKILDVGCGKGVGMKRFSSLGWEAFGLDPSLQRLKLAKKYGERVLGVGEALPFRKEVFDAVLSSNVLHHANNPRKVLCEIRVCLKTNGHLLIAEVLEDNPILGTLRRVKLYFEEMPVRHRLKKHQIRAMIEDAHFTILAEKSELIFTWVLIELARKFSRYQKGLLVLFLKLRVIEEKVEKKLDSYSKAYYLLVSKFA